MQILLVELRAQQCTSVRCTVLTITITKHAYEKLTWLEESFGKHPCPCLCLLCRIRDRPRPRPLTLLVSRSTRHPLLVTRYSILARLRLLVLVACAS